MMSEDGGMSSSYMIAGALLMYALGYIRGLSPSALGKIGCEAATRASAPPSAPNTARLRRALAQIKRADLQTGDVVLLSKRRWNTLYDMGLSLYFGSHVVMVLRRDDGTLFGIDAAPHKSNRRINPVVLFRTSVDYGGVRILRLEPYIEHYVQRYDATVFAYRLIANDTPESRLANAALMDAFSSVVWRSYPRRERMFANFLQYNMLRMHELYYKPTDDGTAPKLPYHRATAVHKWLEKHVNYDDPTSNCSQLIAQLLVRCEQLPSTFPWRTCVPKDFNDRLVDDGIYRVLFYELE